MKNKKKIYLRLNLISLFFVVVSFISVTLAWFVYSGLSTVGTEVTVKSWYIELERNGEPESNNMVISLDEIYPGMEPRIEEVKIKNLGDSDAQVKYNIKSVRILDKPEDNYVSSEEITSDYIEDRISHEYPFHINIDLSKKFILAGTDEAVFKVSISWPLDSGNDISDSLWGNDAYKFKLTENQLKKQAEENNEFYDARASIRIDIELTAEQYIKNDDASDIEFRLGNEILYDVVLNKKCTQESTTCLRTNVIDVNNKVGDKTVTLLPRVSNGYTKSTFADITNIYKTQVSGWTVGSRLLTPSDVLNAVSKDIKDSVIVRQNMSDLIIGKTTYLDRIDKILTLIKHSGGYIKYLNKFSYLRSDECFWLNYPSYVETIVDPENESNILYINKAFAISQLDESYTGLYGEVTTSECKVIPVIIAEKVNLRIQTN